MIRKYHGVVLPVLMLLAFGLLSAQSSNILPADFSIDEGWSCGRFPCADDIDGFLRRIRVPAGFELSFVGRFPGQVMQIAYGPDERLYATVIEDGRQAGAVYVLDTKTNDQPQRYSNTLLLPSGLAFDPATGALYVSGRTTPSMNGSIWRIEADGSVTAIVNDLPCCYQMIDNQPNGLAFGPDGLLYVGVASRTDHAEAASDAVQMSAVFPEEAAILRVDPATGARELFANGIRNPFDLAFDSTGQLYSTDSGVTQGPGDRVLRVQQGAYYGWPFYRPKGCTECPLPPTAIERAPEWLTLRDFSLPRGLTVYNGEQFPSNMQDTLFVALWNNNTEYAQRVAWIDPRDPALQDPEYVPQAFVTGLVRPMDATIAPDGSLIVADFTYGHVWRVRYTGQSTATATPTQQVSSQGAQPTPPATQTAGASPTRPLGATPAGFGFATNTPAP